jgi:hypothetical protein
MANKKSIGERADPDDIKNYSRLSRVLGDAYWNFINRALPVQEGSLLSCTKSMKMIPTRFRSIEKENKQQQ